MRGLAEGPMKDPEQCIQRKTRNKAEMQGDDAHPSPPIIQNSCHLMGYDQTLDSLFFVDI